MDLESIFSTIFVSPEVPSTTLRHLHIRCPDAEQQIELVKSLTEHVEEQNLRYIIGDGNCLLIDQSPKDLFSVLIQAFSPIKSSTTIRSVTDFLKRFNDILCADLSSQYVLCLRRAEYLQDIEGFPILADLFRGFGDPLFKKHVKLITLSTVPWNLMLSNAAMLSPMCIFIDYNPYGGDGKRSCVKAVMKLQEKKLCAFEENDPPQKLFCKEFAKQCCGSFEQKTTDPHRLLSLISRVAAMCAERTNPADKEYSIDVVKQAIRKLDDDIYYFNVSDLLSNKKSKEEKHQESLDSVPYYAKFILIASFCCSFNRKATDFRFFDMEREGRKRTAASNSTESNKLHETGPQTFTLTRFLGVIAFFFNHYLRPDDVIPDVNYLINRLCEMRFITRISNPTNISAPKYRCDASSDFVRDIAQSLGIDIVNYLDGNTHDLVSKLQLIKLK